MVDVIFSTVLELLLPLPGAVTLKMTRFKGKNLGDILDQNLRASYLASLPFYALLVIILKVGFK